MTFGAPLALIGLIAVLLPIAIHLLSRHQAHRLRFPTLRFFPSSTILPRRRIRLSDRGLLAIRAGILALAALALAQPRLFGPTPSSMAPGVSRFIVVDSSASMRRATTVGGKSALDSAVIVAAQLASSSAASLEANTAAPALVIPAGIDWLRHREGERELVVISDFQAGVIDSADLASLPTGMGVRLVRIPSIGGGDAVIASAAGRTVRIDFGRAHTVATWSPGVSTPCAVELLTSRARQVDAERALHLVSSVRPCDSTSVRHPAAIIYMEYDERAALASAARPLAEAWMAAAVQRLHDDPALLAATALTTADPRDSLDSRFTVVARDSSGAPLLLASAGRQGLQLWWLAEPGPAATALMAALPGALGNPTPVEENDPRYIPPARLQKWERPAVSSDQVTSAESDARWLWGAVLLLLLLESLIRRNRTPDALPAANAGDMERAA
jgi:hypothetical protein